ncbi:MAG: 3-isopropylmalate dehydratase small subunit [Alphaproteobacteria bacterium]|nr:3-isopropylmalate dehydratase small subunit [Alphaproteobacteria bacterium]
MHAFTTLTSTAVVFDMMNVDTDMIIPKQFLKTIEKSGLGDALFFELRYDEQGDPLPAFPLNTEEGKQAKMLIAGENFGCGSSREHAPWALLDFGIQVIIAPSFADIFHNNCFRNGMLPIVLPQADIDAIKEAAGAQAELTVDLQTQTVTVPSSGDEESQSYSFDINPFRKECLLNGWDDVALILQHEEAIATWEQAHQQQWRFADA